MSDPRFSIVIPCFNQGAFLKDCLESLASQTLPAHEIIVVNDGSTDPWTTEQVRRLCQAPIQLIEQENRGLSGARNVGVSRATGDWILPLDCDDQLTPDALACYAEAIAREPDVDIWYPDLQHFGLETSAWDPADFNPWHELWNNQLLYSSATRRTVYLKARYNERMRAGYEDWEFHIHTTCELGFRVKPLRKRVFRYRRWGYSMIASADAQAKSILEQMHKERPIFQEEGRLLQLKSEHSPFFAIAAESDRLSPGLSSQTFRDFKVVEETGRVGREGDFSAFHGKLGRYLFVSMGDRTLERSFSDDPHLLDKLARVCESRSPSIVWLVATDKLDSAYPGFLCPVPPQQGHACVGFVVSLQALFNQPRIPRDKGFAEDLAGHLNKIVPGGALALCVGRTRGEQGVTLPAEESSPPQEPPRWTRFVGAGQAAMGIAKVLVGPERLQRIRDTHPFPFQFSARLVRGEVSVSRALQRRLNKAVVTPPRSDRAGPLVVPPSAGRGPVEAAWLVATAPARYAALPAELPPAILIAVPWIVHGGTDRAVIDLLQGLSRVAPSVRKYVATTLPADNSWATQVLPFVDGIFSIPDLCSANPSLALRDLVARLRVDTVLAVNSQVAFDALPAIRQLSPRVRVVVQLHSFVVDPVTKELGGHPRYVASRYNNLVDSYALISRSLRDTLSERFYVSPSKMKVIYLGIDTERFSRARCERMARRPMHVLWLGRLSEEKAPDVFLRVAQAWKARRGDEQVRFTLAGGGPLEQRVREQWEAAGLQDVVQLTGAVPDPVDLLREADCLMMTSRFEGIPVVIYEAMAAGLPVITPTRNTAIREVLSANESWFIESSDGVEEYVEALEEALAEPEKLRARAEKMVGMGPRFGVERYATEMLDLLLPKLATVERDKERHAS